MPGASGSPLSSPGTPAPQAGQFQQPRKVLQLQASKVQNKSSGAQDPVSQEPGQDTERSDLPEDKEGVQTAANSPEMIHYDLGPDADSETVDSGLKQTGRTVTTVTTKTTQVEQRKSTGVQQTGQSTTTRDGAMQPRRDPATLRAQGVVSRRPSFYHADASQSPGPVTPASVTIETRRFTMPSKSSFVVEDSLVEIQHLHRQETDHMITIMKARLREHEEYRLVYEEQFEAIRMENEKLLRQVSASASEITLLKIQLSSYEDSHLGPASSHDIQNSTVTATITTITTTITTVTTRIEQWRDEVDRNKGQITISRMDLDRLLSDLSNTSSQMIKLQQDYTELLKEFGSVRNRLQTTSSLCDEKDRTIASITAEDTTKAQQIITLRRDNELFRRNFSDASSQMKELQQRNHEQSEELVSANKELNAKSLLIEERDRSIASLTAQFTRLQRSDVEKTQQITTLQQECEKLQRDSSSKIAELQKRCDVLFKERDSVRNELQDSKVLTEEKDRTMVALSAEVEKHKRVIATMTEQLDAEHQEKEKLRRDLATLSSQIADLQERCDAQSKEVVSLRSELQTKAALLAEQEHTITSLTTERDQALRELRVIAELLETARQEAKQLREKLSVALDEKVELQKRLDALSIDITHLHNELDRIKILQNRPGADISDNDVAESIARALEEKEKQIVQLREELVATTSQYHDAQKSHAALSSKLSTLSDELTVKTSQYDATKDTIDSLTSQVNQLRGMDVEKTAQITELVNEARELHLKVSTSTAQFTELQGRYEAQSQELSSVSNQFQALTLSHQGKDHDVSSLTAERDQLTSANATKAEQLEKLRQELSDSTSQLTELQERCKGLSDDLASVTRKLEINVSSSKDKDSKIDALINDVAELRRQNDSVIETARKQVEDLQRELTNSNSQIAKLEHDNQMQLTEINTLRNQLEAMKSGDDATISSLNTEVEKWRGLCATKGEELMATRRDLDQLHRELDISSSRLTESQQRLTAAQKNLEQLRRELDTSSSRIAELQQELKSKTGHWQQLDATKTAELTTVRAELEQFHVKLSTSSSQIEEYHTQVTVLTTQVEQWKRSHAAKEDELATASKSLEKLQHDVDASSSQITELRHRFETQSAELKFFREQFPVIPPGGDGDAEADTEEWSTIRTKIMTEVRDYATVIKLTTTVDEWLHADAKRAEVLAAELEKRNRENEELRHKLITLKDIYIRAPRIKQIFQSETIEVRRRYEEESKALKSALAESQSQLRGVQRVVATADTYADEMIIQMLKKLNAEVQQNTTLMAEGIAEGFQPRTTHATKEQISATQRVSESIGKTLASCLASMKRDDVELYLSIAFQAYFSHYLRLIISSWTIEKGHNDFISEIYEQLQKAETQPMSGRWRALTRAYISPTWMSNPSSLTQQIVAELSDAVVAAGCAASATPAKAKLSSFKDKLLSIVSIAGQFSEMIGKVVSADFAVIAPSPHQIFEETTMEEDVDDYDESHGGANGTAAGQKVLCSTHLGMTKRMQRESAKETLTVIRAKVVLESFLHG